MDGTTGCHTFFMADVLLSITDTTACLLNPASANCLLLPLLIYQPPLPLLTSLHRGVMSEPDFAAVQSPEARGREGSVPSLCASCCAHSCGEHVRRRCAAAANFDMSLCLCLSDQSACDGLANECGMIAESSRAVLPTDTTARLIDSDNSLCTRMVLMWLLSGCAAL